MKLQKQLSRRYGGKDYPKWLIVIPPATIEELGWKEGDELVGSIDGPHRGLLLKRQSAKGGAK